MKGLLFFGFIALASTSNAVLIDDFSTGAYNTGYFSSGSIDAWNAGASVLGGIRYVGVSIVGNPLGNDARLRVQPAFSTLQFSSEAQVDADVTLGYGFANGSFSVGSNALNFDLSAKPKIEFKFSANDVAMPANVRLYTNNGSSFYDRSITIPGGISPSSPQSVAFDFSSSAALLTDVDSIIVSFNPALGGDFSVTSISAVPEPITLAVLSLGLLGLRKKRA